MEWPDQDCTLKMLKLIFGNDLVNEVFNTAPDVATVDIMLRDYFASFPLWSFFKYFFYYSLIYIQEIGQLRWNCNVHIQVFAFNFRGAEICNQIGWNLQPPSIFNISAGPDMSFKHVSFTLFMSPILLIVLWPCNTRLTGSWLKEATSPLPNWFQTT